MKNLQKAGGIASLIQAITFIVGLIFYVTILASSNYGSLEIDPVRNVAFLVENQTIMYIWNIIIYIVFGIFLVVQTVSLYDRLKSESSAMLQISTVFGFIWACLVIASGMVENIGTGVVVDLYGKDPVLAGSIWLSLKFVVDGLGGGNEIVGGLWVLLLSISAFSSERVPKALNFLGAIVGFSGIVTVIPPLGSVGALFGLGLIVWYIWMGIVMMRS